MVRWFAALVASMVWTATAWAQLADSAAAIRPLSAGIPVPSVWLKTIKNQSVDLAQAVQGMPTVLVFYRGGWSPYCTRHLSALQGAADRLRDVGYQVMAISPDPPDKLRETVQKFSLGYTLLSDNEFLAAQAFGLAYRIDEATEREMASTGTPRYAPEGVEGHYLPVPAVFLVSPEGVITFAHVDADYTVRLEPSELLKTAEFLSSP